MWCVQYAVRRMSKPAKRLRTSRRPENTPRSNFLSPIVRRVQNGLRHVDEYQYQFTAHAKGRWVKRGLLEICEKEFIAQTAEYYKAAILDGRIRVNGEPVPIDYIVDHNDLITHNTTCHENPVSGDAIAVILEDDRFVAVSKPASIPVHACGGYRLNTLTSILQHERNEDKELLPAHRIDRLTSGLVILGKTPEAARDISEAIQRDPAVDKIYLALVTGELDKPITVRGHITCIDFRIGKFTFENLKDDVPHPTSVENPQTAVLDKYSETEIEPLKYYKDRDETLVKCRPITGRTHQIRLHLQSLGHPIANDVCYGGRFDETHPHAYKQIPSLQHDTSGKLFCGGIFLHAWKYVIPSMKIAANAGLPGWAADYNPN